MTCIFSSSKVNLRLVVLFTDRGLYARALACFFFVFKALDEALAASADKVRGDYSFAQSNVMIIQTRFFIRPYTFPNPLPSPNTSRLH
jgi:hypothetical protein